MMNCSRCDFTSDNRLDFYRIQVRGLRSDSNKTIGKSRRSKLMCGPCAIAVLGDAKVPGGEEKRKGR